MSTFKFQQFPTLPSINWGHGQARGLVRRWPLFGGLWSNEQARGDYATEIGGNTRIDSQGVHFDGSGDYIYLGPSGSHFTDIIGVNSNFTLSIWAKTNLAPPNRQFILGDSRSSAVDNSLWFEFTGYETPPDDRGTMMARFASSGFTYLHTDTVFEAGAWVHLVLTRNGSLFSGYSNGKKAADSITQSDDLAYTSSGRTALGRAGTYGSLFLNGSVRDFRIYNRALSAGEVRAMYLDPYALDRPEELFVAPVVVAPGGDVRAPFYHHRHHNRAA